MPGAGVAHRERDAARRARGRPDAELAAARGIASSALRTRFSSTCRIWSRSASTGGSPGSTSRATVDAGRRLGEEREHRRDELLRRDRRALGRGEPREPAELVHDPLQPPDLVRDGARPLVEDLAEVGAPLLERVAERLDAHRDGRERVLDLVGEPPRHLAPGGDPLGLHEPRPALREVARSSR